jgi:hypothetical protein
MRLSLAIAKLLRVKAASDNSSYLLEFSMSAAVVSIVCRQHLSDRRVHSDGGRGLRAVLGGA